MTPTDPRHAFYQRFDRVRRKIRTVRVLTVLATAVFAVAGLIAGLAAWDFRAENAWDLRATALGVGGAVVAIAAFAGVLRILRRWSRPATAAELEHRFPELGQRVRTSVQYSERDDAAISQDGAAPSLVEALVADTDVKSRPLGVESVAPTRRLLLTAALAAAAVAAVVSTAGINWEWKTALERTLLADKPYTQLNVEPGNLDVEEGRTVKISALLSGRTARDVVLMTRKSNDPAARWSELTLDPAQDEDEPEARTKADAPTGRFDVSLPRVEDPLEYRIVAGPVTSDVFKVGVRYPLEIQSIHAVVTPPAYTGLAPKTLTDGNITALKGGRAVVTVALDRPVAQATATLRKVGVLDEDAVREHTADMQIDGNKLSIEFDLVDDLKWSIAAKSQDGTPLPDNSFRIRVRDDQAPQIGFASPDVELEVHTLAEIPMRIRAGDDYGLTRTGIVFQINNNEEHTLLEEDFKKIDEAVEELKQTGAVTQQTRASLERVLPLEHFALTQKDCVIYYAFAEDNFPEGPHRTETDLRFIDIRPFKQIYRIREPGEPGAGGGDDFVSLEEIIRRQRYVLNRTMRLSKRPETRGSQLLNSVDRLIATQNELADFTRELAEQLIARGADDVDALFQAESSMLAAVDSLSVSRNDDAALQEKDAQQYLVEARNRLEILLMQAQNNSALRRALGLLDRQLSQKLRRRNQEDEESPQQIIDRLRRLADEEQQISTALTAMAAGAQQGGKNGRASGSEADPDSESTETPEPGDTEQDPKDDPEPESDANMMSPKKLEQRQYDVVVEAQDLQRIISGLNEATDLAKERMEAAAAAADKASGTLARGGTDEAGKETAAAAEQFDELARQMAALLAEETSQKIAMARDDAAGVADRERRLADSLKDPEKDADDAPPDSTEEDESQQNARMRESRRLAARAKTFSDVLNSVARNPKPEDGDAADRVAEIAADREIAETVERIEQLPEQVENPQNVAALDSEIRDTAERMESTARELDRLYRSIVMPRLEQLKDLEKQTAELEQEMQEARTEPDVQEWNRAAGTLTEDLAEVDAGGSARDELDEMVNGAGEKAVSAKDWKRGGAGFKAPKELAATVRLVSETLQRQIQELVLADVLSDRDEPTPPEYQHLVDRYLKVLATEVKE